MSDWKYATPENDVVCRINEDGSSESHSIHAAVIQEYLAEGGAIHPADPEPEPTPTRIIDKMKVSDATRQEFEDATTILGIKKVLREIIFGREE